MIVERYSQRSRIFPQLLTGSPFPGVRTLLVLAGFVWRTSGVFQFE